MEETKTIQLPSKLNIYSLLQLLRDVDISLLKEIVIDFAFLKFVYPDGIGPLAAVIDKWLTEKIKVIFINAPASEPFQYLQRMDFFKNFNLFEDENFTRHTQDGRFAAIEPINSCENDVKRISNNLINIITPDNQTEQARSELLNCLSESINNIQDHARLGAVNGYSLAQAYNRNGNREYVIVAADTGIGIRKSLTIGNGDIKDKITDDTVALEWACKPGITGGLGLKDDFGNPRNQGQGLATIDKIAESTKGSFYLFSGTGFRSRNGDSVKYSSKNYYWHGTIVIVKLNQNGILKYYDSVTKTRISRKFE